MSRIKESTRSLTRPMRRLYWLRQKEVRGYEAENRILVQLSPEVDLESTPEIGMALAFTQGAAQIDPIPASELPFHGWAISDYVEYFQKAKPQGLLALGKKLQKEETDALDLLQIPYRTVIAKTPQTQPKPSPKTKTPSPFPENDPKRSKWSEATAQRHVIYAHMDRTDNIAALLKAARRVRRNFPDLLLIIGGLRAEDIPHALYGFTMRTESENLKDLHYFDILRLKSPQYQPLISSISIAQLITPCRKLRNIARQAIANGAAVVFYDVRPQALGTLNGLVDSGTIWSLRKRDSLGSSLVQVLDIDASANISSQSIGRLTDETNELLDALDTLMAAERAA